VLHRILSQVIIDPGDLDIPRPEAPIGDSIAEILRIVFGLAGAIATLVIVIAGIMFILSQGDPQKAAKARNTIIYAAVGLGLIVAAFSLVSFVAGKV
jgi:hypothetical protein